MGYVQIVNEWDYCDSCDKPKPLATGRHTIVDGLSVTWQCEDCK